MNICSLKYKSITVLDLYFDFASDFLSTVEHLNFASLQNLPSAQFFLFGPTKKPKKIEKKNRIESNRIHSVSTLKSEKPNRIKPKFVFGLIFCFR